MKRRALLAALVPLTAGCFSGTRAQTSEPTDTATPVPRSTPAETPEPTPAETPAETPEPTPAAEQTEAVEAIDTAQDRLREAVYIYTGGVSNDLLDVSADTSGFDDRSVLLKLSDVQTAVNEAERVAATAEQTRTVDALRRMQRFLTQATDLQAWLIEGHEAITDAHDAIDDEDGEEAIEEELDAVDSAVEGASRPLAVVTEEIEPAAAGGTDTIEADEFERKQTQFEHELDVLGQLRDALSTVQSARSELDAARSKADDGEFYSAEEAADRAAESLEDAVDDLEDLDDDPPSRAGAFEDRIEDVLALTRDYAAEADDLHDRYE